MRVIIYREVYFCTHNSRRLAELKSAEITRYTEYSTKIGEQRKERHSLLQFGTPRPILRFSTNVEYQKLPMIAE